MIVTREGTYDYVAKQFTSHWPTRFRSEGLNRDQVREIVEMVATINACDHVMTAGGGLQDEYSKGWCQYCGAPDEDKTCAR